MPDRHRFSAVFRPNDPYHQKAWEILTSYPPRRRMNVLCDMICKYQDQKELIEGIRRILEEHLGSITIQNTMAPAPEDTVDDNVVRFLKSLQGGETEFG